MTCAIWEVSTGDSSNEVWGKDSQDSALQIYNSTCTTNILPACDRQEAEVDQDVDAYAEEELEEGEEGGVE